MSVRRRSRPAPCGSRVGRRSDRLRAPRRQRLPRLQPRRREPAVRHSRRQRPGPGPSGGPIQPWARRSSRRRRRRARRAMGPTSRVRQLPEPPRRGEGPKSENLQELAAANPDTWIHLWIDGTTRRPRISIAAACRRSASSSLRSRSTRSSPTSRRCPNAVAASPPRADRGVPVLIGADEMARIDEAAQRLGRARTPSWSPPVPPSSRRRPSLRG